MYICGGSLTTINFSMRTEISSIPLHLLIACTTLGILIYLIFLCYCTLISNHFTVRKHYKNSVIVLSNISLAIYAAIFACAKFKGMIIAIKNIHNIFPLSSE